MKRSVLALATASMLISAEAFAKCDDGPPFQCVLNGKIGTRQCVGPGPALPDLGPYDPRQSSASAA